MKLQEKTGRNLTWHSIAKTVIQGFLLTYIWFLTFHEALAKNWKTYWNLNLKTVIQGFLLTLDFVLDKV